MSERFDTPVAKNGVLASPDLARDVVGLLGGSGVRTMLMAGMLINSITASVPNLQLFTGRSPMQLKPPRPVPLVPENHRVDKDGFSGEHRVVKE